MHVCNTRSIRGGTVQSRSSTSEVETARIRQSKSKEAALALPLRRSRVSYLQSKRKLAPPSMRQCCDGNDPFRCRPSQRGSDCVVAAYVIGKVIAQWRGNNATGPL